MLIFVFWFIFAILVGSFASSKGRSGIGYFFLALIISPLIAFIIVLVVSPIGEKTDARALRSGKVKQCPSCAELVKAEAAVCKHCSSIFGKAINN